MTATYRFGRIELSPATRQVLVDHQPAPLGARAFDVLLALIERRDRLVGKDELLDLVWPGLVVEENNLQVQISTIRKLLGQDAITTVAGHGYRFALELADAAEPPPSQGPKHNLPAQTTPFIGRENAIRAVKETLSNANVRLLTLSGVGGTGKTRLALQATADMVDEFEHGVYFVSLAALSDPALVLQAIAQALAVREAAGRPLQEQLQSYLCDRQMLLVLDNFEQVIDAAPRVSELVTAAPRLKVLVTSREVLRLSGETEYPVPPLSLPDPKWLPPLDQFAQYDAVALFVERARAVKPAFVATNENATAIAEICHRLDGLPLAIELAAARTRVLPPQRMLAELSHRLSFLTGGARDLPARQRALRSAINWSHALLTGNEQQLFRRLAVFVGGCDLEAIESVCNVENELSVLDTVESLVGKSLVKQTEACGQPRFAMLETIREYARERLIAAGDEERVRGRHRDYFLALAEEAAPKLAGPGQVAWLRRLEEEHENLRAGLDWSLAEAGSGGGLRFCGALGRFWWIRGHVAEGRDWCARVLHKIGDVERTLERAEALTSAGVLAFLQGDYAAARAMHEESLAIARELGQRTGIAVALNNLGNVSAGEGDIAAARTRFEESLAIGRELGDRTRIAIALSSLGYVASQQHEIAFAEALFQEGLTIARELGNRYIIARVLCGLGEAALAGGEFASAQALLGEGLLVGREIGDRDCIAACLRNLGIIAGEQDRFEAAKALHEESCLIWRELGDKRGIAFGMEELAGLVAALGDSLRAARIWGSAARLREEIRSPLVLRDRARYDRRVAAARASLGDGATFDQAWHEGRALTLEQAIAFALETTAERP